MNEISKRKEYGGKVRERVQALSECCHGGQIIIDAATFEGISNCMTDLVGKLPVEPDFSAIADYTRCGCYILCASTRSHFCSSFCSSLHVVKQCSSKPPALKIRQVLRT